MIKTWFKRKLLNLLFNDEDFDLWLMQRFQKQYEINKKLIDCDNSTTSLFKNNYEYMKKLDNEYHKLIACLTRILSEDQLKELINAINIEESKEETEEDYSSSVFIFIFFS